MYIGNIALGFWGFLTIPISVNSKLLLNGRKRWLEARLIEVS
jgi:hypothetical protein